MITFNKPYLTGKETQYIEEAVRSMHISGNGIFTKKCQQFFEQKYGFKKCLLTTSCTDALEMCAILADIQPNDEVIIPSYTFVSTALAFVRQGAKIVFADSEANNPNIDADKIEALITPKTKAIVPVHYAGAACDMEKIMQIAEKYNLLVIEDAAQAIDSFYCRGAINRAPTQRALGSIGHLAAFSFHETKNIISGEGGMLVVNDERFVRRAEIIWEKGTNRAEFFRGEVNKYGWVDTGSSFLPSEIIAAFLWAQIEHLDDIQNRRKILWNLYYSNLLGFENLTGLGLPNIPSYATNNAHMFYLTCNSLDERTKLIAYLKEYEVLAVFHYLSLHSSDFYAQKHDGRKLPNCDKFADCLVRLPMFYELKKEEIEKICNVIKKFYEK
ncbi:MAG: dTDP-4-amino-4,6-dideoxygalactose transaminase [Prevotellaceae bacterium]|jgi:dTDP-4-amino-4,6-dideoxygalactose transaminase|nr:dTDP-4-amino-4,6-dideoxygalactose transaminase [Prevotellaceae bacterium]